MSQLYRRQRSPLNSVGTTSGFDGWPYPTRGADTSLASTLGSSITPTLFVGARPSDGGFGAYISQPTPTPTSSISAPNFDASASSSLIHISALPAATTSIGKHVRLRNVKSFNAAYLAPLFAVIGVALGALCGWILIHFHRYKQRRRGRSDSLEPGPEYTPPPETGSEATSTINGTVNEDTTAINSRASSFLGGKRLGRRNPSSSSIISRQDSKKGGWVHRVLTTGRKEDPSLPNNHLRHANDRISALAEADPFLTTPQISRPTSSIGSGPPTPPGELVSQARALLASSPISPESAFDYDEWERIPYESLRHQSIRRGIVERLKQGQRFRVGHKRTDSDLNVDEVKALSSDGYSPVSAIYDSPQRSRSLVRSGSVGRMPVPEKSTSAPGFRIVDEDVGSRDESGSWKWALPWAASSKKPSVEDRLSPVPVRRSVTEKRSPRGSPSHSRTPSSLGNYSDEKLNEEILRRVDASVLPASPPMLTSPPLQAQLFFGPIPESIPVLDVHADGRHMNHQLRRPIGSPPSPLEEPNKLHTSREPPPLPYPSSDRSSPYRNKLTKSPPHNDADRKPTRSRSPSVDGRGPQSRSLAERRAMRHGAINRVEEILARSWSQREMRGEKPPGSPTMFGALPSSPVSQKGEWGGDVLGGIEERLAQL